MASAPPQGRTGIPVLLLDEDGLFPPALAEALADARVVLQRAPSWEDGLRILYGGGPRVVVICGVEPFADLFSMLCDLRDVDERLGILVVMDRDDTRARSRILRAGADEVLTPAFGLPEALARIIAMLRRIHVLSSAEAPPARIGTGFLEIDLGRHAVRTPGGPVSLSPGEYRILATLARRRGDVVRHADLVAAAWGEAEGVDATASLSVLVSRLRTKLGKDPRTGESPIATVRGFGYRLVMGADGWSADRPDDPAGMPPDARGPRFGSPDGDVDDPDVPDSGTRSFPGPPQGPHLVPPPRGPEPSPRVPTGPGGSGERPEVAASPRRTPPPLR